MELEELKTLWSNYDKKLDKSLQLNMKLLRQVTFDKASKKLGQLLFLKIVEMLILMVLIIALLPFTFIHMNEFRFSIPSLIITPLVIAGFASDVRQLGLIVQIRKDTAAPVSDLQKKAEKLKLLIVKYTRTSFIFLPFYPFLAVVGAKMFLNLDFWAPPYLNRLIPNIIIAVLLIPLFLWLFRQLGKQNVSNKVVKSFLTGSGWNQAKSAEQFLEEIEKFEKGE
jgi:hypothetical protein